MIFSAIGDVPYDPDEIADLEQHVADHNRYSPSAFLIHLGDIQSSSEACQEIRYQTVADVLKASEVPVFIVPGDNEWVGCADPAQGWAWWEEHLLGLEQSFCGIWPLEAQATRPENFSFVRDGVLFLGLNKVSGTPSSVVQADADWVNAQFAAYGASARAAVLMAQEEPSGVLWDAVLANGRAFGKPLLYIHGDGHSWIEDPVFFGEPNMLRVQVDRGNASAPPVQVTVTAAGLFLFDRDPWPPGSSEIVRPPCGSPPSLSIDDLFVNEGQSAVFTVALSGGTGSAVSVSYSTQDGTARAGEDYTAKSGSLSFSGTTIQRQISVAGIQDSAVEPGESFFVNLTNPAGAAIAKPQGAAVILDDESPPPPSGGSPTLQEVVTGVSTSSSVVSTSGPIGAASGALYLAVVSFKSNLAVSGVSGLGLAWTQVRHQCAGRGQTGVALFRAQGNPSAGGIVTANLAAAASAAVITVARYSGASSTGPIGAVASANTNGVSGACSGGVDGTAYDFNLSTGAANSLVFVAIGMRSKDHLPGSGYNEIAETYAGSGGSTAGASLAQRLLASAGAVGVNGGFDGTTDWAVVAAEVLPGAPAAPVVLSVTASAGGSVTLNPPGGSYTPGTPVTLTAVPSAGYAFTGWSGALSGMANPASLVMDTNKSVGASFSAAAQYTLTVAPTTGGSVTLSPPGGTYASGTTVTLTAVPAAGYTFAGWSGALTGSANPTTLLMNANKSVTASFAAASQFTVTVLPTTGGSVTLSPSGGVYAAGTSVTVTAVPAAGYRFGSWNGALSGTTNPRTLLVDANKTLSAAFIRQYQVSVSHTGSGSVVLSPSGGVYDAGTVVTVTAVPSNSLASFLGWGGDLSGLTNPTTLLVNANKSVSANFTVTYTLSVSIRRKGSVTLNPPGGTYLAGTQVTLTAVPAAGYAFEGWSGALSGVTNPAALLMNQNQSVTASFRRQ